MSDTPTPSSSTEKAIGITNAQLRRLWIFTYISIGLNVVILAVIFVCAVVHHHEQRERHDFGEWGNRGGPGGFYGMDRGGYGPGFRHFGGMGRGWGGPGFDGDRQGSMGFRGNGFGDQGPRGSGPGRGMGGGWGGNPGMMGGGGPGMRGMMGGDKTGPPDPAKMTDMVLNRLSTQLNLTDDEKAKIKPLVLDTTTQIQKSMEAQRAANQKAMEDTKARIKALLTPDQQKQLDAMPLPGEKPPGEPPPPPAGAE